MSPTSGLGTWCSLAREYPTSWKGFVRKYLSKVSVKQPPPPPAPGQQAPPDPVQIADLALLVLELQALQPVPEVPVWVCNVCGKSCKTAVGLGSHLRKHGYRHAATKLCSSSRCPICLGEYWSRPRCIRHLRENKTGCLDVLQRIRQPLPPELLAELEAEDRAAARRMRRQGLRPLAADTPAVRASGPLLQEAADLVRRAL